MSTAGTGRTIPPTVGRIVLFQPGPESQLSIGAGGKSLAAIIAAVLPDGRLNLTVSSWKGHPTAVREVQLVQEGEPKPVGSYAHWMDYQLGQAAKAEQLEQRLGAAIGATAQQAPVTAQGIPARWVAHPAPSSLQASEAAAAAVAVAPRVTLADIEAAIAARYDVTGDKATINASGVGIARACGQHNPLKLLSICILVMKNGFTIVGKSAPASPENFNAELGRKIAYEDALQQVWPLMGFALREKLAAAAPIA
jgi:N4 Gp49/Sf6 Gp66 family protein